MFKLVPEDSFVQDAKKAKFNPNVVLQILLFIAVLVCCFSALFIIEFIPGFVIGVAKIKLAPTFVTVVNLLTTPVITIGVMVYCRLIEKRNWRSMGFIKKGAVKQYLFGVVIGAAMIGLTLLISILTGSMEYVSFNKDSNYIIIAIIFIGFLLQGMEEEVLLRSYFFPSLSTRIPVLFAIIISSLFFAALHLLNSGITVLSLVNLALYGVFMCIYVLKTNSIFGACAIHSIWNFIQGNVFGILVSGQGTNDSVFTFAAKEGGSEWFNGGAFGLEGGFSTTIVLVVAMVITLLVPFKKKASDTPAEVKEVVAVQ